MTFGAAELDHQNLDGPNNRPVDCRDATFESLSLQFGTANPPSDPRGVTVSGQTDFGEIRFDRRVDPWYAGFAAFSMRLAWFDECTPPGPATGAVGSADTDLLPPLEGWAFGLLPL